MILHLPSPHSGLLARLAAPSPLVHLYISRAAPGCLPDPLHRVSRALAPRPRRHNLIPAISVENKLYLLNEGACGVGDEAVTIFSPAAARVPMGVAAGGGDGERRWRRRR